MVDEVCQSVSLSFACVGLSSRVLFWIPNVRRDSDSHGVSGHQVGLVCDAVGISGFVLLFLFPFSFFPPSVSSTQFSEQKTFDYRPATTNSSLNTAPSLSHPTALEVCDKVKVIFQPAGFIPFH
jgi:hypothetical protein